jgi:hypothetical protein
MGFESVETVQHSGKVSQQRVQESGLQPRRRALDFAESRVGPFYTHGTLGGLFASGLAIATCATMITVGVTAYAAVYGLNCQSETAMAWMVGSLFVGSACCLAATTCIQPAARVFVTVSMGAFAAASAVMLVHYLFMADCWVAFL